MWDRKLISAIFNFDYKWEVYTPVKERKFGYYVLPIIYNDEFIGRCESIMDRKKNELLMQNWWWEEGVKINQDMINALMRCLTDSQTSESNGTIMMVPLPSESRDRKETYPVPWGGIEPPKRFWVQGLPWGMIPFILQNFLKWRK